MGENRPSELFFSRFPIPTLMSAECYIDKYGPAERYNIVQFVDQITCPSLFVYGQVELDQGGIAFAGMPEAIGAAGSSALDVKVVSGADHFYTGQSAALIETVLDWLRLRFARTDRTRP